MKSTQTQVTRPWQILVSGVACAVLAAATAGVAWQSDTPGLFVLSWVVSTLAGLVMFVGLVAWAVEIGIRSARN